MLKIKKKKSIKNKNLVLSIKINFGIYQIYLKIKKKKN